MSTLREEDFGRTGDGDRARLFTLQDGAGCEARLTNWGATLVGVRAPDRYGSPGEVVLGFDSLSPYLGPHPHFGASVGRYANRIAYGHFELDGEVHALAVESDGHHLHGGRVGFGRRLWGAESTIVENKRAVLFRLVSPDGEEGYPGRVEVELRVSFDAPGVLRFAFTANTDRPTVLNMTQHAYFNLRDGGASPILDHRVEIDAEAAPVLDEHGIPTGEVASLDGSPLDFRPERRVGDRIAALVPSRGGYDHCYALRGGTARLRRVARVTEPERGRVLEVSTTQPGLQLYTGNGLDGSCIGHENTRYDRWHALCLETQHYPDSPNHPEFPSTRLAPDETYEHVCEYRFGTDATR